MDRSFANLTYGVFLMAVLVGCQGADTPDSISLVADQKASEVQWSSSTQKGCPQDGEGARFWISKDAEQLLRSVLDYRVIATSESISISRIDPGTLFISDINSRDLGLSKACVFTSQQQWPWKNPLKTDGKSSAIVVIEARGEKVAFGTFRRSILSPTTFIDDFQNGVSYAYVGSWHYLNEQQITKYIEQAQYFRRSRIAVSEALIRDIDGFLNDVGVKLSDIQLRKVFNQRQYYTSDYRLSHSGDFSPDVTVWKSFPLVSSLDLSIGFMALPKQGPLPWGHPTLASYKDALIVANILSDFLQPFVRGGNHFEYAQWIKAVWSARLDRNHIYRVIHGKSLGTDARSQMERFLTQKISEIVKRKGLSPDTFFTSVQKRNSLREWERYLTHTDLEKLIAEMDVFLREDVRTAVAVTRERFDQAARLRQNMLDVRRDINAKTVQLGETVKKIGQFNQLSEPLKLVTALLAGQISKEEFDRKIKEAQKQGQQEAASSSARIDEKVAESVRRMNEEIRKEEAKPQPLNPFETPLAHLQTQSPLF